MAVEVIQVDDGRVRIGLNRLELVLAQNRELMEALGASQLKSIYKTFEEEGSPAGSWMPLAPSTIRRNRKLYGPGHKLLILSGRLRNSIRAQARQNFVTIGTNLIYARVQQMGSADRSMGIGPRTQEQENALTSSMAGYSYLRLSRPLGKGKLGGHSMRIRGPRNQKRVFVRGQLFGHHQNIPPRPYLVFRPEDPERLREVTVAYTDAQIKALGLEGAE